MSLKIFSSRDYLLPDVYPASIFYPLWPDLHSDDYHGWTSPYSKYTQEGSNYFELVPLHEADIAILPFNWRSVRGDSWRGKIFKAAEEKAIEFANMVRQAGKPLVIFFESECSDENIPIKDATIYRQSVYRSSPRCSDAPIIPFFCEDFVQQYLDGTLPLREKSEKPVVGFRGLSRPLNFKRRMASLFYHSYMITKHAQVGVNPYSGEFIRHEALKILANSPKITSNIETFESAVFFQTNSFDEKMKARMDYVENMVSSDYIFCCRGSGNYSNRLYEVLSCGRIPILLDTDGRQPLEDIIDWKKCCIWVDRKDMANIADIVADFHAKLSNDEFQDLQRECRKLWIQYLSPTGYYSTFAKTVKQAIKPRVTA